MALPPQNRRYPSQELKQVLLRVPEQMRERLQASADEAGRSLTAEILLRLESSFPTTEGWLSKAQQSPSVRIGKELLALEARMAGQFELLKSEFDDFRSRIERRFGPLETKDQENTMGWTIEKALDDDLIQLENRNDALGVYEFRVGILETIVSVDIGRLPSSDEAKYHRSHDIKTPVQAGPYHQSRPYWDDIPYALHQAISSITSYYREAVKAGHKPKESWLVKS